MAANIKDLIIKLRDHIDNTEKARDLVKSENLRDILDYFYSFNEYGLLLDNYPSLFQLALKKDFDYSMLDILLSMQNKVTSQNIDTKSAEKEVGEIMADKFMPSWRNK